jgi:hypothetical protein
MLDKEPGDMSEYGARADIHLCERWLQLRQRTVMGNDLMLDARCFYQCRIFPLWVEYLHPTELTISNNISLDYKNKKTERVVGV